MISFLDMLAFFDVRVTNINSASSRDLPIEKIFDRHEKEKKRQYNHRVINIEHGTFTPLVFSVNGGMGPECTVFHKHLAEKIARKTNERYENVLRWVRCKLSFLILRAALLCLRGSRTIKNQNTDLPEDFNLACEDARI